MRKRSNMFVSYLKCGECGKQFPIMRSKGYKREKNHVKDLWCPFCKREGKFIENTY